MKNNLKFFLLWAVVFIAAFLIIYLFVFFGGWRLFESNDPILIEIGAAFIISVFVVPFCAATVRFERTAEMLEKRIKEIEEKIADDHTNSVNETLK